MWGTGGDISADSGSIITNYFKSLLVWRDLSSSQSSMAFWINLFSCPVSPAAPENKKTCFSPWREKVLILLMMT